MANVCAREGVQYGVCFVLYLHISLDVQAGNGRKEMWVSGCGAVVCVLEKWYVCQGVIVCS